MNHQAVEITLDDPGTGQRLGEAARGALTSRLREARKGAAPALLLRVCADAWDQDPIADAAALTAERVGKEFHALVVELFSLQLPVVAHLEGRVSGLGLSLALACDVRLAGPGATLGLGAPQASNPMASGVSWLLAHRVGSAAVADLAWTGRFLGTDEALSVGLLSRVTDAAAARALADELAGVPAAAASALKRSLNARVVAELSAQLEYDAWLATVSAKASR